MRADRGEDRGRRQPGLRDHLGQQRAEHLARPAQRRQQLRADAQRLEHHLGPAPAAHVEQPGGGRVGRLGAGVAAEPVAEQVGDEQQRGGRLELGRADSGGELVDGVHRDELQPGDGVELLGWDAGGDLLDQPLGAGVPVVVRVAEQRPGGVEQPVVDAPGVHGDAGDPVRAGWLRRAGPGGRRPEPVEHLPVQPQDVPVQPVREADRHVGEAVRLGQLARRRSHPADHDPPAGGAEVDGGVAGSLAHRAPHRASVLTVLRDHHRRKAAATPASTGTSSPVVRERSPAVSASTAAATCSGKTSRPSSVRLA